MSEKGLNNNYKYLDKIARVTLWITTVLFGIFICIFVYTPEYNGIDNKDSSYSYHGLKIYLNTILNYQISRILLILIGVILLICIAKIVQSTCKEFSTLNNKLKEISNENIHLKENLDKHLARNLEKDNKIEIVEKMKLLIANFSDIISVQIYECIKSKRDSFIDYEIKPTIYYYTKQNEVANLIHERYHISESSISEYLSAKDFYNQGKYEELEKYIRKLIIKLNDNYKRDPDNISDEIINEYSLLTLALQLDFDEVSFSIVELNNEFQEKINNYKRNGFLRGIIENKFYKFSHDGSSNKGKRIYITRCLDIENRPHMFTIVLQPSFRKDEYFDEIATKIEDIFYVMLEKDLNLVYNDIKIK